MMFLNSYVASSNFLEILILIFTITQVKEKLQMINDFFRIQNKYPAGYEMLKIAAFILFMSHMWGCLFHLVGQTEDGNSYQATSTGGKQYQDKNWLQDQGLQDADWYTKYIFSVYFSIITMVTVGFGDIHPVNIYEKIFVIGMTIISCGIFAYCVNSISSIFSQLSQKNIIFKQKQYDLLNYMNQKNIKMETQTKIMKYLEYLEQESDQCIPKGEAVLSSFPLELKEQIMKEYFVKILQDVPIINENFSLAFLNAISLKMKEKILGPSEKLLVKNTRQQTLYFITKGSIEYSIDDGDHQKALCQIQSEKSVIDFRQFITGLKPQVSIQSTTMTNVAYISYNDFIEEIKKFKKDYEKFCYLRDQFLNDGRFEKLCPSCNHFGHEINNCPQIHFSVNRPIFSQKVFYSIPQLRQQNPRQRFIDKRISWRNIYHEVRNDLKYLRWAYVIEYHNLYNQVNIDEQIKIIESDKSFFKRCPKIKPDIVQYIKKSATTQNMLNVIIEENEDSDNTQSNSEESDFQTDYSETQVNQKNMKTLQDEDVQESQYADQGGGMAIQVQNISIHSEKYYGENPSLSNIILDGDINTIVNDSINQGSVQNKSEASIKRQESLKSNKRKHTLTGVVQQQISRSQNKKLTNELQDFDKMRSQTRHLTNRSIAQIINSSQAIQNEKSSIQQSYISYQQDFQNSSSMTNSLPGKVGQNTNQPQKVNNNQQESLKQLDQLVEKFKRQCMKMMTNNLKVDYFTHISQQNSKDENQSKIFTLSRQSKATNRVNTYNSISNTQQCKSIQTIKSLQENLKKNKVYAKDIHTIHQKNFQRYGTSQNPQMHIFGPLQFKFDKIKEYQIYYPKGNASNIIKVCKKIQSQNKTNIKIGPFRHRYSGQSDQLIQYSHQEKFNQLPKKVASKLSKMSYVSQMEERKNMPIL
ncbi:hypothetical protein ABPG72_019559 [Tetrahymena utriculariae]